jgi:hypothetical protein
LPPPLAGHCARDSCSFVPLDDHSNRAGLRVTCESNLPKLQATGPEKKLFDYLSKELAGFLINHGLDSSIDPYFKSVIFESETSATTLKQLTKDAGMASVHTPTKPKSQKPTPTKPGVAAAVGGGNG